MNKQFIQNILEEQNIADAAYKAEMLTALILINDTEYDVKKFVGNYIKHQKGLI